MTRQTLGKVIVATVEGDIYDIYCACWRPSLPVVLKILSIWG
ncbi:MAG: hypothetical protein U0401_18250 [Anaerolineae bacterium]